MITIDLDVLFVDNHLLAIHKPAGIPTQDDPFSPTSLEVMAKEWVKENYNKPGNVFLHPIHRIDKPVSGIVLFARTSKALSRMNEQMRERSIEKTYLALTDGYPPAKSATLEHYLVHEEHYAKVASGNEPEAKLSILQYRVLCKKEGRALIEIKLHTGRYHQIRVQLSAIGCPILGDKKYGSTSFYPPFSIALSHSQMGFLHPVSKERIEIKIPCPFAL